MGADLQREFNLDLPRRIFVLVDKPFFNGLPYIFFRRIIPKFAVDVVTNLSVGKTMIFWSFAMVLSPLPH